MRIAELIEHLEEALIKIESVVYTLQFVAPSEVEAHAKMLAETELAGAEIRRAIAQAREMEQSMKYGGG